jgi:protein phosphatase
MDFVPVLDITKEVEGKRKFIIGDVHGTFTELLENDVLISVGDLVDRGYYSADVVNFCMFTLSNFYMVQGNHDDRFRRYLSGNNVKITHGLQTTIDSYHKWHLDYKDITKHWLSNQPYILKFDNNYVVHAGINPTRPMDKQFKQDCIYSRYFGGKDYFDNEKGQYWYKSLGEMHKDVNIFFGHEVHQGDYQVRDNVWALDGGCVFGGELRMWNADQKRMEVVYAREIYSGTKDFSPNEHLARSRAHFAENVTKE